MAAVALCMMMTATALVGVAGSAAAEPTYPTPIIDHVYTYYEDDGPGFTYGHVRGLALAVKEAVPQTTLTVELFGCGSAPGGVHGTPVGTYTATGSGSFEVFAELYDVWDHIGGILAFRATWSAPGYQPYDVSGWTTHPRQDVAEQICDGTFVPTVEEEIETVEVARWSRKLSGRARVGETLRISRTIAADAKVLYRWYVRNPSRTIGKLVGRRRSLLVKPSMRGLLVSVTVSVERQGYYGDEKTIRYTVVP